MLPEGEDWGRGGTVMKGFVRRAMGWGRRKSNFNPGCLFAGHAGPANHRNVPECDEIRWRRHLCCALQGRRHRTWGKRKGLV